MKYSQWVSPKNEFQNPFVWLFSVKFNNEMWLKNAVMKIKYLNIIL